jgi:hypothetical protein
MLKCVSKFRSDVGSFVPGDIIDDPKLEAVLLASSELSFEVIDKAVKEAVEVKQAAIVEGEGGASIRKRRILGTEG